MQSGLAGDPGARQLDRRPALDTGRSPAELVERESLRCTQLPAASVQRAAPARPAAQRMPGLLGRRARLDAHTAAAATPCPFRARQRAVVVCSRRQFRTYAPGAQPCRQASGYSTDCLVQSRAALCELPALTPPRLQAALTSQSRTCRIAPSRGCALRQSVRRPARVAVAAEVRGGPHHAACAVFVGTPGVTLAQGPPPGRPPPSHSHSSDLQQRASRAPCASKDSGGG